MRTTVAISLAVILVPYAADAAAETKTETITIAGEEYTVIPDQVMRKLGFTVLDLLPEENAAPLYREAMEAYSWPREDELSDIRESVVEGRWTEASGPLSKYLKENEAVLPIVEKAVGRPDCRFPFLLRPGEGLAKHSLELLDFAHLPGMVELIYLLIVQGKKLEFDERSIDALETYLTALRVGTHLSRNGMLIDLRHGVVCNWMVMDAIERCILRHEIDENTLATTQASVARISGKRPDLVRAWRNEHVWTMEMAALSAEPEQFRRDAAARGERTLKQLQMPLPEYLKHDTGFEMDVYPIHGARIAFDGRDKLRWTVLDHLFALARYQLRHGKYAKDLDALKPLLLSDGLDPFSGERLNYRLEKDGSFTIWSIGEDGEDNDGTPGKTPNDFIATDIVWNSRLLLQ